MPVYANHYFLKEASKIAQGMGFRKDRIFVPDNGSIIKFTHSAGSGQATAEMLKEKAPTSYVFVDGLGVGDVGEIVLRDRQMLAEDGMFVIVAVIDKKIVECKLYQVNKEQIYVVTTLQKYERDNMWLKDIHDTIYIDDDCLYIDDSGSSTS